MPAELVELVSKQLQGSQASNEIRRRWMARNEPSAKLARQRERLRRWLLFLVVIVLVFGVITTVGAIGLASGGEINTVLAPGLLTLGSGALAVQAGTKLRRVRRQLDAAPPSLLGLQMASRERLPAAGSSAREPMQRLREYEMSFADLVKQMWSGGAVPHEAVRDAVDTADAAAAAVRRLGEQLRAVEGARNAAPRAEQAELSEVVRGLRQRMDDGASAYGKLVATAGRTVAASAPATDHQTTLTDATDQLAGIALALQELSERDKLAGS